ncbi:hypothetical protein EV06_1419 [Prochlorococcus sp. MIT 0602]|nr:hypothetical protein EV06_1419 [Prochlorococcus sp. MIT 0602]KGG17825.1 hypothetical protein EV07_1267 [Prochlorococcus sp. MIT 0603]
MFALVMSLFNKHQRLSWFLKMLGEVEGRPYVASSLFGLLFVIT